MRFVPSSGIPIDISLLVFIFSAMLNLLINSNLKTLPIPMLNRLVAAPHPNLCLKHCHIWT